MEIYVQTRGKTADYSFLGKSPTDRWWLNFRDATSFEQPTLIVQGDQKNWKCFLSGIPSNRKDRVDTIIRYTLVLEGDCKNAVDKKNVLNLIAAWLQDTAAEALGTTVKNILDSEFKESAIERFINSRTDTSIIPEIKGIMESALNKFKEDSIKSDSSKSDKTGIFFTRTQCLLNGDKNGVAGLFNLLGTQKELTEFSQNKKLGNVAALIIPSSELNSVQFIELFKPEEKKVSPETLLPIKKQRTKTKSEWLILWLIGILGIVIIVATVQKSYPSE